MNDASITSVNDMVKANDALKSNYIYFCTLTVSGVCNWYKGSLLITISLSDDRWKSTQQKENKRPVLLPQYGYIRNGGIFVTA